MNPETNKFERLVEPEKDDNPYAGDTALKQMLADEVALLRPNGEPVPKHWSVFSDGELVAVKDYTFKVVHIGESYMVIEPVGPVVVGERGRE